MAEPGLKGILTYSNGVLSYLFIGCSPLLDRGMRGLVTNDPVVLFVFAFQ